MNLSKHRNVQYCELDKLSSHVRSHYYMRHEHIFVNGEPRFFEVVKSKKAITDKVPIATAFFILCHAKLTVFRFIHDLTSCINLSAVRLLYMGKFQKY